MRIAGRTFSTESASFAKKENWAIVALDSFVFLYVYYVTRGNPLDWSHLGC